MTVTLKLILKRCILGMENSLISVEYREIKPDSSYCAKFNLSNMMITTTDGEPFAQ